MYNFNVKDATNKCIEWIKEWFDNNGKDCNCIIGISGGKDSSVCASLCVKALGKDRVFGVLMPQGTQHDIDFAYLLCKTLDIKYKEVNIKEIVDSYNNVLDENTLSKQAKTNLPSRVRMCTLYAISQSMNGRVANTCNMSEDWVGYSTKYGDAAGDFSPLSSFTVTEVKQIGEYLGLPRSLTHKIPIDGLCGKTDEENLGFTYDMLDKYIREGIEPEKDIKEKIDLLHERNLFKLQLMPSFKYSPYI